MNEIKSLFKDVDAGKEVSEEVKQRLIASRKAHQDGKKGISADEVYKKLGLNFQ